MENLNEEKKINQKEKNKAYYEKNKDKFKTINQCNICPGKYAYSRKSQHNNSKLHTYHMMKKSIEDNAFNIKILSEIQKDLNEIKLKCV